MPQKLVAAVRDGLAEEMRRDPSVWVLGEDVSHGGIFGTYAGLIDEFGAERIVDTPISESLIVNAGFGAALAGTRPVIELRIADFALCGFDEIINQIAKARYMFGGQARVPVVLRLPQGLNRYSAAQHSQTFEAWFVNTPGLVVVAPSNAADAKGLLKSAIRCDDPVVLLEAKNLWQREGEVPAGDELVPIGPARIARRGSDVTIVAWSSAAASAEEIAPDLASAGIDVEIVDLRTLWPWDVDAVLASVRKTGRVVVASESSRVGGFAAEVVATIYERAADALRAPVARLGAPRTPVPFSPPLEDAYRVEPAAIAAAVRSVAAVAQPA